MNEDPARGPGLRLLQQRLLSLRDKVEQIKKLRKADGCSLGALDQGISLGAQGGYAEGHGDAMVAAGVDGRSMQSLTAGDIEPVLKLLHVRAHGPQIARDQSDAIRFLDAQFLRIANADAAARAGSDGGKHRKFVDQLGRQRAADFRRPKSGFGSRDLNRADEFGVQIAPVRVREQAENLQGIEGAPR